MTILTLRHRATWEQTVPVELPFIHVGVPYASMRPIPSRVTRELQSICPTVKSGVMYHLAGFFQKQK
jgi:hypothetical protein